MPSVSGKFTGIQISNITNGSNLLDGNSGNASFNEGQQITYRSPAIPSVFFGATVTGYSFIISWALPVGISNVTQRWFMMEQQSDGTALSTGTVQERTIGASSSLVYGGSTELFDFSTWTGVVSDLSLNLSIPLQLNLGSTDDVVMSGTPGLTLTVHYTTTPTSKVYLSGGKVSITSGRASIT